jgi:hypothetical protein
LFLWAISSIIFLLILFLGTIATKSSCSINIWNIIRLMLCYLLYVRFHCCKGANKNSYHSFYFWHERS